MIFHRIVGMLCEMFVCSVPAVLARMMHAERRKRVLLHFFVIFAASYALGVLFLHCTAVGRWKVCGSVRERGGGGGGNCVLVRHT